MCGFLCVRCVCVRVSMGLCGLFVAPCVMLFGLPFDDCCSVFVCFVGHV